MRGTGAASEVGSNGDVSAPTVRKMWTSSLTKYQASAEEVLGGMRVEPEGAQGLTRDELVGSGNAPFSRVGATHRGRARIHEFIARPLRLP